MSSILITGGAGSFATAFAKRLLASPMFDRICLFSRGEHRQAMAREMLERHDRDKRLRWFIGDVRDQSRLRTAMQGCSVVVHAAALKRIEVGAYNAIEMVRTNVDGAINVVEAAAASPSVFRVVALSTDKAWQPISPYGHSKALAEQIFLQANQSYGGLQFFVTRYGNVAGSAGSVIPKWREIMDALAMMDPVARSLRRVPVQMTDPECTRFWMSMAQAVDLVHTVVTFGDNQPPPVGRLTSRLVIPEGLPAYRLGDLATAMGIVDYEVTGLPEYEKLHEGMRDGYTSDTARRLSVDELRTLLREV